MLDELVHHAAEISLLARAERAGLVVRSAGPGGCRSVIVALTEAGHAVAERTVDAVLGREAQLVDGLTGAERAALAGLLDRLLREVAGRVSPGLPRPEPDPPGPGQPGAAASGA